jgi:hypothetical protein
VKKDFTVILLAASIAFSGVWIGNALKNKHQISNKSLEVLSLTEASDYLKISEKTIKQIIRQEDKVLSESGTFSGMMFPYTEVNGQYIFSKKSLDKWVEEASESRDIYSEEGILN